MVSQFDPQIIYTAEACGYITRIDLRSESSTTTLFKNKRKFGGSGNPKLSSVKAVAQSRTLGEFSLLFGGHGLDIRQIDIRMIDADGDRSGTKGIIRQWGPHYLSCRHGCWDADSNPALSSAMSQISFKRQADIGSSILHGSLSVSGLQISGNGRTMVASYQGDQIYTFDLFGRTEQELIQSFDLPCHVTSPNNVSISNGFSDNRTANWDGIYSCSLLPPWSEATRRKQGSLNGVGVGAEAAFGGHQNYQTFLKQVSFFGPKDEYIVSGSDSGDMFVWDSRSGTLLMDSSTNNESTENDKAIGKTGDRLLKRLNLCERVQWHALGRMNPGTGGPTRSLESPRWMAEHAMVLFRTHSLLLLVSKLSNDCECNAPLQCSLLRN